MKRISDHRENQKQIEEELRRIAPELAKIPRKNPFSVPENYFAENKNRLLGLFSALAEDSSSGPKKEGFTVPEGYFEQLPGLIMARIEAEENPKEEIRSVAPVLAGLQGQNPFRVPDNYFAELKRKLYGRTRSVRPLFNKVAGMVSLAAALLVVAVVTFQLLTNHPVSEENLNADAIAEFMENNINDFDETVLVNALDEETIDRLYKQESASGLEEDELNDWLEQNLDLEILEEELL